ncbi:MAG: ATP-binding cassette domain-containing protein, partial [Candidatus Izemoplasma sp.]
MIEIKDLVINLKDAVIKYPNFTFENKKVYFVKGKNGTGKSILLKAIADLVEIEQGIIRSDSIVTYVAQEPYMFDKTVYGNIVYPLKIRKLDISLYEEDIMKYAKALEIEDLLKKNAKNLSSGEKMKVSIIR